jgi:hypothetical protein
VSVDARMADSINSSIARGSGTITYVETRQEHRVAISHAKRATGHLLKEWASADLPGFWSVQYERAILQTAFLNITQITPLSSMLIFMESRFHLSNRQSPWVKWTKGLLCCPSTWK